MLVGDSFHRIYYKLLKYEDLQNQLKMRATDYNIFTHVLNIVIQYCVKCCKDAKIYSDRLIKLLYQYYIIMWETAVNENKTLVHNLRKLKIGKRNNVNAVL